MAVTTYTEYLEREHAFFVGTQISYDDAETEHAKCLDDAQKKHDQTMQMLATVHPTTAAEAQALADAKKAADDLFIEEKTECDNQRADKITTASNLYQQNLEDLQKEAAESLARVERLIITLAELEPAAVALQNLNWYTNSTAATRAPILTVSSLDDLQHELEADRGMFELLLLVRAEDGELIFGTDRRKISDIIADVPRPAVFRVLETIHLRGELVGAAPDDTDSLRILGTPSVVASWSVVVPPVAVEIQVNNTLSASDDVVLLKCAHPSKEVPVPCHIELKSGPSPVTVVLHDPNDRIRFPNAATKTVTLSHVGHSVPFQISGHAPGDAAKPAGIEARVGSLAGPVCGTQPVTVVSFTNAEMVLTQGGNYGFGAGDDYTVLGGGNAMSFRASATIEPSGVCAAPQIAPLRVGIMQEASSLKITVTWDNPQVTASSSPAGMPKDTPVPVPRSIRGTVGFDPSVAQPVNDGDVDNFPGDFPVGTFPLYTIDSAALTTPQGCPSVSGVASAPATGSDAPGLPAVPRYFGPRSVPLPSGDVIEVYWTHRANVTYRAHFRTFCVIFDTSTNRFCALQQAVWDVDVDDSKTIVSPQHATVTSNNEPATANPTARRDAAGHPVQGNQSVGPMTTRYVGGTTIIKKPF